MADLDKKKLEISIVGTNICVSVRSNCGLCFNFVSNSPHDHEDIRNSCMRNIYDCRDTEKPQHLHQVSDGSLVSVECWASFARAYESMGTLVNPGMRPQSSTHALKISNSCTMNQSHHPPCLSRWVYVTSIMTSHFTHCWKHREKSRDTKTKRIKVVIKTAVKVSVLQNILTNQRDDS